MNASRPLSMMLCASLASLTPAAVSVGPDRSVANATLRVVPGTGDDRYTGFRVFAGDRLVADVHLGPGGVITADRAEATVAGDTGSIRFTGLRVAGGAVRFAPGAFVLVQVAGDSPWPRVSFDLPVEAFDVAGWQRLVGGTLPFHFLTCSLAGAGMFYQGGGMIPLPEVDPFPLTAVGFMAGEWAKGWTYAPPFAGWAVPAVGLWNHRAATFVGYDFNDQRHTDRSGEMVASAGCAGNGGPAFFCLVWPHQHGFTKLTYPQAPFRTASHFELIHTDALPDSADPNQFVLERLWREKRPLLPPVPRMNDLAWIPEYDGFTPGGGIEPTCVGSGLVGRSINSGLEGAFVEPGAAMLGNDFIADGILRARTFKLPGGLDRLREDLTYLMPRCSWIDVNGDRCATWVHPAEGKFKQMWGGERCAGIHHPSTFQIGAGMILLYQATSDERLLPYIDGVYNWCKHYLFTRGGVCDLSWAMFSREATAVGENFLLTYRKVFRNDPVRGANAEQALQLARTAVYKNLWFYTADPDPTDDLDPVFLNQATNDCRWAGRVTWNEAGWVLRTMVPVYCDTGDPFLKYLLRGSLERYYAGFRDDGGIAENLQILGEFEPKGARTGGFPDAEHGGSVRRYARAMAPATMRVAMGQRAALAFCLGTRAYDIADFGYAAPLSFSFRVVGLPSSPPQRELDIIATAPFRDLRRQAVRVNSQALPAARYEFNPLTDGEDVLIHGVRPGDVVQIGDGATTPVMREEGIPYRTDARTSAAPWDTVDLGPACNLSLKRGWWEAASWCGLAPGHREAWGIPVELVDPETNAGKDAVTVGAVAVGRPAGALFAVLGRLREGGQDAGAAASVEITFADGQRTSVAAAPGIPFDLTNGFPLRQFDTFLVPVDFGGTKRVQSVAAPGATLLALTLGQAGAPEVRQALVRADEAANAVLADRAGRYYQAPLARVSQSAPWVAGLRRPWRLRIAVHATATDRGAAVISAREDFAQLLGQVGLSGTVQPSSLRAIEVTPGRPAAPVPVQFDPLSAQDSQEGELLLLMPGVTAAGQARSFDVYFGPEPAAAEPAVRARLDGGRVQVSTGPGGLQFEFALGGAQDHPRWTRLAFDSAGGGTVAGHAAGDGTVAGQPNVLGASGYNGGLGDLTGCTDWVTWYDFGGLQTRPARAEVLCAGPVATTVRISGLELWGQGNAVTLGRRVDGTPYGAAPAGEADWYFRFYAGKPVVEQWVTYRVDRLDHGWTRPVQVRYGLNRWTATGTRTAGDLGVAWADDLALVVPGAPSTTTRPECMYTPDGNVLQIAFTRPDALGTYFAGRWFALPPQPSDAAYAAATACAGLQQFAVEALVDGRVVTRAPRPLPLREFDRTGGLGPGPRPQTAQVIVGEGNVVPDPSFEQRDAFWALGSADAEARWTDSQVYSGKTAVDLSCTDKTLSLVTTNSRSSHALNVRPDTRYEVSFWARCTSGEGEVLTNFYSPEPGCDFPHIICPVPADGQWHRVRVTVPTGAFQPADPGAGVFTRNLGLAPALRLWTYHKAQTTYVDQVEARPLP